MIAIVVSLVIGYKVATPNHFHTHDDIQIFRTNEFLQCFKDGQFPCRWSRDLGKGYGYPLFIFYSPMIYAIPAILVSLSGISIAFALNISAYITFPLAAFAMYRLIKVLTNRNDLAGICSVLFTMLPYHAVNVFVRGVYAENLVWAIAPLLLAEVYLVVTKKKSIWTLTIIGAVVLLTHNISTMILIPILGLWAGLLLFGNKNKYVGRLESLIMALLLAIGVAAWYLLPALTEKPIVQTESMIFDYYSYLVHFPSLKQVFLSNFWGYGGSSWGVTDDGMSFALGQVQWGLLAITALLATWFQRKTFKKFLANPILWAMGSSLLLLLFMAHPRSTPVWIAIPAIQYIQFPWRLVGMAGMLTVVLTGYLLTKLPKKIATSMGIVATILAILLYRGYFQPEKYDGLVDSDYIGGSLRNEQQQAHLFDYLPKTVKEVPNNFSKELLVSAEIPLSTSETLLWKSNHAQITIDSPTAQEVSFSIFNYPGWEATINKQEAPITSDIKFGLITLTIPSGRSEIELNWKETTPRKIGNAISFVSFGILVLGIIFGKPKAGGKKNHD